MSDAPQGTRYSPGQFLWARGRQYPPPARSGGVRSRGKKKAAWRRAATIAECFRFEGYITEARVPLIFLRWQHLQLHPSERLSTSTWYATRRSLSAISSVALRPASSPSSMTMTWPKCSARRFLLRFAHRGAHECDAGKSRLRHFHAIEEAFDENDRQLPSHAMQVKKFERLMEARRKFVAGFRSVDRSSGIRDEFASSRYGSESRICLA